MVENLMNKIANALLFGGAGACFISIASLLYNGASERQYKNRLELLQELKADNPSLVVDTKTYEEKIKNKKRAQDYSFAGFVFGSFVSFGGEALYKKN